jgi:hypothetical protein
MININGLEILATPNPVCRLQAVLLDKPFYRCHDGTLASGSALRKALVRTAGVRLVFWGSDDPFSFGRLPIL